MQGIVVLTWFDAMQTADRDRQLGEFSDAEIAARQAATPRRGPSLGLALALVALARRALVLPKQPAQA